MKNYFCILLTLILIFKHSNNNFITFPFKKILPSDIGVDETNFYSKHENNVIFTNIKIGTPATEIKAQIKTNQYSLCIRNDSIYNNNLSSSYSSNGKIMEIYNIDYSTAISSNETFFLGNEQIKVDKINFMFTQKTKYDLDGILGLQIKENNYKVTGHGLISQLKNRKLIGKEVFFFSFDENGNDGNLYIGEYPHSIKKFENEYQEYNYKWTSIYIPSYDINFDLKFEKIFWKEKEFQIESRAYISIEKDYIVGSNNFEDTCYDFFAPFIITKKCKRENVTILYNGYICDDTPEINISNFSDIKFYKSDADHFFILTYEDMFIKKNGKIYFMVLFAKKGYRVDWTLGYQFIKRNKIIFDIDKRVIGFYKGDKKEEKKNSYIMYIAVISLCCAIILGLIGFIIIKFIFKKRYKRANELEDEYEYNSPINA